MACEEERVGDQQLFTVRNGEEVLGFVAIDSTVGGRARGGLRLLPDVSRAEIAAAARSMTLKYGLLGLPQGGAKAGVIGDPDASATVKHIRLVEFARAAEDLLRQRVYVPDADMGTRASDIRRMMAAVGLQGRSREWRENRSGFYTAISCAAALGAAADRRGLSLAGARVAIEGFGSVGSPLAMVLAERGAAIVAVSTAHGAVYHPAGVDLPDLLHAAASLGSSFVATYPRAECLSREALLALPIDVLCPCARYQSLHPGNADAVQAVIVCAGANNPVHPSAERLLEQRGVLVAPDFVSNCGGVLGGTLEFAGVAPARIRLVVEAYVYRLMSNLMELGERRSQPLRERIEVLARRHHAVTRSAAENRGVAATLLGVGLEAFRRGWLPPRLVAPLALRSIRRRCVDPTLVLAEAG